jgi:hypothetical protein
MGIPLGDFTLSAIEPVNSAIVSAVGTLAFDSQTLELGDLLLDNSSPRVESIEPPTGANHVPLDTALKITFNEPMDQSSFDTENLVLLAGTTAIPMTAEFSADGTTITITPDQPLESSTAYTLTIRGPPEGPKDLVGLNLLDPVTSTFLTEDTIPPAVVSVFPIPDQRSVLPEAVVRVTFSEPVTNTLDINLRNGNGVLIPGSTELTLAGTVAIFTPIDFLKPNSKYELTVESVADGAGNDLNDQPVAYSFYTVDTNPPVIESLAFIGDAVAGNSVTLLPTLGGDDTNRVEYFITGAASQSPALDRFQQKLYCRRISRQLKLRQLL